MSKKKYQLTTQFTAEVWLLPDGTYELFYDRDDKPLKGQKVLDIDEEMDVLALVIKEKQMPKGKRK